MITYKNKPTSVSENNCNLSLITTHNMKSQKIAVRCTKEKIKHN